MPTIISHAAIPIAGALIMGRNHLTLPIIISGVALSMLPDADVIGFRFGVEYGDNWGHRGASHSLIFSAIIAAFLTAIFRPDRWRMVFAFLCISSASHGLLDMATNGGLGVALYWPFEMGRHFWPFTPIEVSPIGIRNFLTLRGLETLISELFWIWLPLIPMVLLGRFWVGKMAN